MHSKCLLEQRIATNWKLKARDLSPVEPTSGWRGLLVPSTLCVDVDYTYSSFRVAPTRNLGLLYPAFSSAIFRFSISERLPRLLARDRLVAGFIAWRHGSGSLCYFREKAHHVSEISLRINWRRSPQQLPFVQKNSRRRAAAVPARKELCN